MSHRDAWRLLRGPEARSRSNRRRPRGGCRSGLAGAKFPAQSKRRESEAEESEGRRQRYLYEIDARIAGERQREVACRQGRERKGRRCRAGVGEVVAAIDGKRRVRITGRIAEADRRKKHAGVQNRESNRRCAGRRIAGEVGGEIK